MITLAKVRETFVEKGKLIIKSLTLKGASTAKQVTPFGIDSNPLSNWTAIYADTTNAGEAVILGYINKDYITEQGEIRIYSIGDDQAVKAYVYARKDGVLELNGSDFSAVRFQELKTQIDLLQSQINSQWPLIASGIATGGGVYTHTNVSIDLATSESATVKIK
jgi:hypothetical protein